MRVVVQSFLAAFLLRVQGRGDVHRSGGGVVVVCGAPYPRTSLSCGCRVRAIFEDAGRGLLGRNHDRRARASTRGAARATGSVVRTGEDQEEREGRFWGLHLLIRIWGTGAFTWARLSRT